MPTRYGELRQVVSSRGNVSFQLEIWHDELGKHRTVRACDRNLVVRMASVQMVEWEQQWERKQEAEGRRRQVQAAQQSREERRLCQEAQKASAEQRTGAAKQLQESLALTLDHTLGRNDAVDWERLRDRSAFPKPPPVAPPPPAVPELLVIPPEPNAMDAAYQPEINFLDRIFAKRREQKVAEWSARFRRDHLRWEEQRGQVLNVNTERERAYQLAWQTHQAAHQRTCQEWECERQSFLARQQEQNEAIAAQQRQYLSSDQGAIAGYCELVLSNSQYPECFPKEWDLDYNPETKMLLVDYRLPAPHDLPTLTEVRYVAARDEFSEKHLSEPQIAKLYDDLVYQIALRTIHELLEADQVSAIEGVVFNGAVHSIDRATGKEVNACILSLQASRAAFLQINLAHVDPKACFRQLKGVGSSKLHSITPVAPIMRLDREDSRFVPAYGVADQLDDAFNLAAMHWEDFEHLIREVFAKEFASSGGEVKVTQASRDGGVDAVAFDPDPIRGGKIVIQAKRYTNTVGVAAVRDLYGTVMNEGATKGILVSTSDYGPDAYEFAKGKPLSLLNGSNLLHLLERHGHSAKIDLAEARRLLIP